jgi:hypothetical protein
LALSLGQYAPRCRAGKIAHRTGVTVSKIGLIVPRITITAPRIGTIILTIIIQIMGFTLIAGTVLGMKQ